MLREVDFKVAILLCNDVNDRKASIKRGPFSRSKAASSSLANALLSYKAFLCSLFFFDLGGSQFQHCGDVRRIMANGRMLVQVLMLYNYPIDYSSAGNGRAQKKDVLDLDGPSSVLPFMCMCFCYFWLCHTGTLHLKSSVFMILLHTF